MSDLIVINKCDGENVARVMKTKSELQHALHMLSIASGTPETKVLTASSIERQGIADVWSHIDKDSTQRQADVATRRKEQNHIWMEDRLQDLMRAALRTSPEIQSRKKSLDESVRKGLIYPPDAAHELWMALQSAAQ